VPVSCSNSLSGAIVLTRGHQEPDLDTKPGGKIKAPSPWTGFFTPDPSLTAPEAVKKYLGRRSIEVFCKEAKPRLGLGQEQGHSFAAQVFSVVQTFCRSSLLAYLLEQEEGRPPSAISSAYWKRRPVSSPSWSASGNISPPS